MIDLSAFFPAALWPTLVLALGAVLALMLGSVTRRALVAFLVAEVALLATLGVLLTVPATGAIAYEGGPALLAFSPFSQMVALLMSVLALPLLWLLWGGMQGERRRGELAVLLLLATLGGVLLAGANHLLTVYVALELMSFPLYILCAWARDDAKSSEAGLKYFVLGSMASGLMLFGMSFIYAATGALDFSTLATLAGQGASATLLAGAVLVLVGVAFKLSLVPFHFYTPDVYEGAPTPVTAMLAALPKLAVLALLVRMLVGPLSGEAAVLLGQGLMVLAVASMVLGAPMAIVQGNLKRLLAFSTVANMGFALVPLVALAGLPNDAIHMPLVAEAASGALFYVFVYGLTSVGLFAALMASGLTHVNDLKGLARRQPWFAAALGALLFSLAGIPPLAGFMGKLLAFTPAVQAGWGLLVLLAVLMSVVASAYSLWLVKAMVFDKAEAEGPALHLPLAALTGGVALVVVALGVMPAPLQTLLLAVCTAIF